MIDTVKFTLPSFAQMVGYGTLLHFQLMIHFLSNCNEEQFGERKIGLSNRHSAMFSFLFAAVLVIEWPFFPPAPTP